MTIPFVLALTVDNPTKPTLMEAEISISRVRQDGLPGSFNSTGKGNAKGGMLRKLDKAATTVVSDVVEDLMTRKVLPQMIVP